MWASMRAERVAKGEGVMEDPRPQVDAQLLTRAARCGRDSRCRAVGNRREASGKCTVATAKKGYGLEGEYAFCTIIRADG